jgi:hypothetical protein
MAYRETVDLKGRTFGHWTVVTRDPERSADYHVRWLCRCDCGEVRAVRADVLLGGGSKCCNAARHEGRPATFRGTRRGTHTTEEA